MVLRLPGLSKSKKIAHNHLRLPVTSSILVERPFREVSLVFLLNTKLSPSLQSKCDATMYILTVIDHLTTRFAPLYALLTKKTQTIARALIERVIGAFFNHPKCFTRIKDLSLKAQEPFADDFEVSQDR